MHIRVGLEWIRPWRGPTLQRTYWHANKLIYKLVATNTEEPVGPWARYSERIFDYLSYVLELMHMRFVNVNLDYAIYW